MTKIELPPIHPGEMLLEEFMKPYKLSARKLADLIGVPPNRITQIIKGERALSADTAFRLERLFGMSAKAWLNIQQRYDFESASMAAAQDATIQAITRISEAA